MRSLPLRVIDFLKVLRGKGAFSSNLRVLIGKGIHLFRCRLLLFLLSLLANFLIVRIANQLHVVSELVEHISARRLLDTSRRYFFKHQYLAADATIHRHSKFNR